MKRILETDRLILRGWQEEDAASLFKYASDKLVGPPAGWLPHSDERYSRAIIRTILSGDETYAICLKGRNNEPVGSIGLILEGNPRKPLQKDEAELGYWIGREFWGRGLVPEAAKEVLKHAFEELNLERVYCGYFDGNEKSKRVQEKLGFKPHHVDRNVEVTMLGEVRVEYVNVISKMEWRKKLND